MPLKENWLPTAVKKDGSLLPLFFSLVGRNILVLYIDCREK